MIRRAPAPRSALPIDVALRRSLGVDDAEVDADGWTVCENLAWLEHLAHRLREHVPEQADVTAADLLAGALVAQAQRSLLARGSLGRATSARIDAAATERMGGTPLSEVRSRFAGAFGLDVDDDATIDVGRATLHVIERNPAMSHVASLFREAVRDPSDGPWVSSIVEVLSRVSAPSVEIDDLGGKGGDEGGDEGGDDSLWERVTAPISASPTSLSGQLAYIVERWAPWLPGHPFDWRRGVDLVRSLDAERWRGAPPGPHGPPPVLDPARSDESWARDVGDDTHTASGPANESAEESLPAEPFPDEPQAFTRDDAWMQGVVMVAKNVFVWMDQLSTAHGRPIERLDDVPDEALEELRRRGFDALWLIGVWERSKASATIKRMRGQPDAIASAYALYDYVVADDLGGDAAWQRFADRARRIGLRLAADMVPNHVGIDGRWVVERPDLLLTLDHSPYPSYSFTGPNLSTDPRVEIRIEDGYWDASDAAVTFERTDVATGRRSFVYHGNDGTRTPWNDTAQIDYGHPEAREAVIQEILGVARRVPIIRFDAAMTLAKRHVRRLWFPPPGEGGAIPSRAAYGTMQRAEFDAMMPEEFWRTVVDRVQREAPGTLLLAEAFWMMEGYFVRSLGMHRVYNSAFMHMLARESNGEYLASMRNVVAFDPRILGRFVNFMNNPDEEPARIQFGGGDKAFAVTTLMVTLPGLPMFGHGQVDGLAEKYGMEFRRARTSETPDLAMVERHMREIAPLMRIRTDFAGTDGFRLLEAEGWGPADVDTFVYANRGPTGTRSLVAVNNSPQTVRATVRRSVPFLDVSTGESVTVSAAEALGLANVDDGWITYRDPVRDRTHVVHASSWTEDGIAVDLPAYGTWIAWAIERHGVDDDALRSIHLRAGDQGVPDLGAARRDVLRAGAWESYDRAISTAQQRSVGADTSVGRAWQRLLAWWSSRGVEPTSSRRRFAWVVATIVCDGEDPEALASEDAPWIAGPGFWTGDRVVSDVADRLAAVVAVRPASARGATTAALASPAVRRWWGVHEANGTTWFRHEGYVEWLERTCDACIVRGVSPSDADEIWSTASQAAVDAAYQVPLLSAWWTDERAAAEE